MEDGRMRAEITEVRLLDDSGTPVNEGGPGESLRVRFRWNCHDAIESPILALTFHRDDPRCPIVTPRYLLNLFSGDLLSGMRVEGPGEAEVRLENLRLPVGSYRLKAYLFERFHTNIVYMADGVGRFEMLPADDSDGRSLLDHRQVWRLSREVQQARGAQ
jgi:hypothetical protein